MQSTVGVAVNVGTTAEDRLRKCHFHFCIVPVLSPIIEKIQLSLAKQDRAIDINAGRIVIRVANMVGARSLFGHSACGTGFKLAVFQNGKVDIAPIQVGEIDTNALTNLSRIDRIGKMAGLGTFDFLDIDPGLGVATVGSATERRNLSAFTPQIGLPDVMVIGQTNGRTVFDDVTKVASKFQPSRVMSIVVVNLIAREEQHVGVDLLNIVDQVLA